jgi:transcription elongation factor greA
MNHTTGKEETYIIVSSSEADFRQKKISTETPIAKALLGKKVGDVVTVTVPKGNLEMEILSISVS